MSREYARELFNLVTGEYGVPVLVAVSPTLEGAAQLFDAAADAGRPAAIVVLTEGSGRTGRACKTSRNTRGSRLLPGLLISGSLPVSGAFISFDGRIK